MPIEVKDYIWQETDQTVLISVPLKGVHPSKVDIFSTDDYLKVSYPPYLFEVCLFAEVVDLRSKATFNSGVVKFQLEKKNHVKWNQLQTSQIEDKEFMIKKRKEAIEKAHRRAQEEKETKAAKKREQEKLALREQMKLEEQERANIEAAKQEERLKATAAIERWKKSQKLPSVEQESVKVNNHNNNKTEDISEAKDDEVIEAKQAVVQKTTARKQKPQENTKKTYGTKELLEKDIPEPRSSGSISVSFTPRSFRTAARESKAPEEEEWLKKMAIAGRNRKTKNDDAVDVEEMNPLWLKDKGNGFYKAGNFVAAINAFTAAIVLDDSIPLLYANRAACHLQLKQYKECIQDCTSALDLLVPSFPSNCSLRCKTHVRRGTAYLQSEEYLLALQDYESAIKLDPKNTDLQRDSDRIRNIIQGSPPSW